MGGKTKVRAEVVDCTGCGRRMARKGFPLHRCVKVLTAQIGRADGRGDWITAALTDCALAQLREDAEASRRAA